MTKNILLIIGGIVAGYLIDVWIRGVLRMLWVKGYWKGFTLLTWESKLILLFFVLVIFFVSKNRMIKSLIIGVIIYLVVESVAFKFFIFPKLVN
jgi:hypothetical protein